MSGADPLHRFDGHPAPPALELFQILDGQDVVRALQHIGDIRAVHAADRVGSGGRIAHPAGEFCFDEFVDLRVSDSFCRFFQKSEVFTLRSESQGIDTAE